MTVISRALFLRLLFSVTLLCSAGKANKTPFWNSIEASCLSMDRRNLVVNM